ncbi:MAG: hypothetical protein AAGC72_11735 [Planctomycetota bacterium]
MQRLKSAILIVVLIALATLCAVLLPAAITRSSQPNYFRFIVPNGYEGPVFVTVDQATPPAEPQKIDRLHARDKSPIDGLVFYADNAGVVRLAERDMERFYDWHGSDVYDASGSYVCSSSGPHANYFDDYGDGFWFYIGDQDEADAFLYGNDSSLLQREWRRSRLEPTAASR